MPVGVGNRFDFQYGGKGYILQRGQFKGRAWQRTGRADTTGQRSQQAAEFGVLPDELDHPEVWDDWSGGFGHPYREVGENPYHWAENFDARFPRQLVHCQQPQLLADTADSAGSNAFRIGEFRLHAVARNMALELLGGGYRAQLRPQINGGLAYIVVPTLTVNYTGRAATFGSHIYMGVESGNFVQHLAHGATEASHGPSPGLHFMVAGNSLWRAHGRVGYEQYLQSVAAGQSPMSLANWSATITIGNGENHINDMVSLGDQLVLGLPGGLYIGDSSGTFVNVLGSDAAMHEDDFRDLRTFRNGIVGPYSNGIVYYRSSDLIAELEYISPPNSSDRSPIRGRFRALAPYSEWLHAGRWTGSQSYLMAGKPSARGWIWHTLQKLPHIAAISRLHLDSISTDYSAGNVEIGTRVWALCEPSMAPTAPVYFWPVPRMDSNPLAPDTLFTPNYIGSARMDLGAIDWNAPATPKIMRLVELECENLASGAVWCQVHYEVDREGTFHLLGTSAHSPHDTLYFPSGEGSFVTGHSIELSLRSFTASPQVTPVYRKVILRGALQPRSVDMITAVVRIGDGIRDRQGAEMRSAAAMIQELRDFGNPDVSGLQAHELIDLAGATQWAKVLGRVEEQEVYQQGEDNPEVAATVRFAVLTYS